ncbi:MAG: FAD-binding oxidoreductase [Gammaproteobacteria bacterium]|nr:FAD-binding oxidoreductase [Gammaproteobacteria bacterium]
MNPLSGKSKALTADALVVGGGIHGCSTALHLAKRKLSVIVVEKDHVGRHASGNNAGGVRRLGRAIPEIPLSLASMELWQNLSSLVDEDGLFEASLQIKVAENEAEFGRQKERVSQLEKLGFRHEKLVDQDSLRELIPSVSPHCVGALTVVGDGYAHPFKTVQAFKRKAASLGVKFIEGCAVLKLQRLGQVWRVKTSEGDMEAETLVNCAGAWGGKIAEMLGESAPVKAGAPMLTITARMPSFITPVVGAEGRTLSFKQFANGTVLIGGGLEGWAYPETNRTRLDFQGIATNAETALAIFPIMKKARVVRNWAGIEGFMPDQIPVIDRGQKDNVFHGFGFSAHGFQLGPIGGKILSDLVIDGKTDLPISAFRIDRFVATKSGVD